MKEILVTVGFNDDQSNYEMKINNKPSGVFTLDGFKWQVKPAKKQAHIAAFAARIFDTQMQEGDYDLESAEDWQMTLVTKWNDK